jgi:outer membrane lipase/esterase
MKSAKRILPALLFGLFAATTSQAQTSPFSGVFVFGDSLSDAGYYRPVLAAAGLPAPIVAQLGRFTTNPDPVWSELVSQRYGFAPAPSNVAGGNIYAQGGARVALPSTSTPAGHPQRPVSTQVGEYLAANSGRADPNALYALWAGGNDFLQNIRGFLTGSVTPEELQANLLGAATAQAQQAARLHAAGARHILVFGVPDVGAGPEAIAAGPATAAAATALSVGFNTTLFTGLAGAGIRAIPVDIFRLFHEIRANPAEFGMTNVTDAACGPFPPFSSGPNAQFCLPSNLVSPDAADRFLFADQSHPTGAGQAIIAGLVQSLIEGPIQHSLLAEAALRTRAAQVRAIGDGLTVGRQSEPGRWNVFVAADGSDFDVESGIGNPGLDSRTRSATLGVTVRASEAVTVGAAFGRARNRGTFGMDAGGYSATEKVWSLFAAMKWDRFYATGIVSLADLDFGDIHRNVPLGTAVRRAEASAEGSNGSAYLAAGYDFPVGRLTIGPTVSVTTQNVDVNGFDESGAGVANLRIHQQKRRSEVWSGGLRASYNLGNWTPWLRLTADRERRDDERLVTATPLSLLAIGSSYDIPAYRSDSSFTTAAIGVNGWINNRVGLSVAAFRVQGRSGIDESGYNAMVSVRF